MIPVLNLICIIKTNNFKIFNLISSIKNFSISILMITLFHIKSCEATKHNFQETLQIQCCLLCHKVLSCSTKNVLQKEEKAMKKRRKAISQEIEAAAARKMQILEKSALILTMFSFNKNKKSTSRVMKEKLYLFRDCDKL